MFLNTLDVKLTSRTHIDQYNLEINESTLEILKIILEFKLTSACHITRFLTGQDQSKYVYRKLRRMWQAGLLESFKVFSGGMDGSVLFYMLSKKGLIVLLENNLCQKAQANIYPRAKSLLSWGLFKHEAQVVELASLESKNKSTNLDLKFRGEASSQSQEFIDDRPVEALTPDYTVIYKTSQSLLYKAFTEFERTRKPKEALLNKIQRYQNFLPSEDLKNSFIRLIFQSPLMEQSFWLAIITDKPSLLNLNIFTTNLNLIRNHKSFLQPIYANESTVKLTKEPRLKAEASLRIKLLNIL